MPESPSHDSASVIPNCPKCQGPMWDNREGKRNPKAPDYKCKDRECDGVIWPPRATATATRGAAPTAAAPTSSTATAAPKAPSSPNPTHSGPRLTADGMPLCPICGGQMWDDRTSKRNPRAPDFKCRNKPRERGGPGCEGVIWPSRDGSPSPYPPSAPRRSASSSGASASRDEAPLGEPPAWDGPPLNGDDLPF